VNADRTQRAPAAFWVAAVVGWASIGYGVRGVVVDRAATQPTDLARWFGGLLVLHDLAVVPVALAVAWLVGRAVPGPAVVPVRLGLASSAIAIALAFPLVRGYGERSGNPSLLPLPYERNLLVVLGVVWAVVAIAVSVGGLRRSRGRR
jgi:hypothetical protein